MDALLQTDGFLWSPVAFSLLIGTATLMIWLAFRPTPSVQMVRERLDDFVERGKIIEQIEFNVPLSRRVVVPLFRRLLGILGLLAPKRNIAETERWLLEAGRPGNLSALDFFGVRLLMALALGGGYFLLSGPDNAFIIVLRNTALLGAFGYFAPRFWLKRRGTQRKYEVLRALPDALDMMTISVEAGLAFESAMFKVNEQWDNALTREMRRAVAEMRVGTPRDEALERMADRLGVPEVKTFVTVLVQSNQLGMSISQVLHTQAELMRVKRRQRAEELARQAGGKMVFPLVICFIPALFVVILGPMMPDMIAFIQTTTIGQ